VEFKPPPQGITPDGAAPADADNLAGHPQMASEILHDFRCFLVIPRKKNRDVVALDRNLDVEVF
jgi:hypothetical protein